MTMTYLDHRIERNGRPRLRISYETDGEAVWACSTFTPREQWLHYWYDPQTGHYGMGVEPRPATIPIPSTVVNRVLGIRHEPEPEPVLVDEYRRDGRRTLRPGQFVTCQPKQRKGTGKTTGVIKSITDNGAVTVACGTTTVEVHADWIQAKNRGSN